MRRLWNNSLIAKVFLSYFSVIALLFTGFYFSANQLIRHFHIATLSERMEQEAHLLAQMLPFGISGASLDEQCRQLAGAIGSRITVIGLDGKVLGDSAEASVRMENHAQRPEVIEAMQSGSGSAIRHSATVGYDMLYRTFHQTDASQERIVRVAMPLKNIDGVIRGIRDSLLTGLLLASAAGLILAWCFSRYLSRRVQRLVQFSSRVAEGQFPRDFFPTARQDEIALLERHLNDMSHKIRDDLAEITAEKEKADSILHCMIEGVLVLDPGGNVLVINDQAKTMFKVPAGRNLYGHSVLELSRHPEIRNLLREALKFDFTSTAYSKEIELEEERWFAVNAVPLKSSQGMTLGSIMVFHDITNIKRLETMRSDFVANVSHELRTPLTAIRGYVETLLHTPPAAAEDNRQFLEIIGRHAERLSRLTDDLLTLSDLESGNIQLAAQPVDAARLIEQVLEVFQDSAGKKNIHLSANVAPLRTKLHGDPDRLQQLLINLFDNAIKYTQAGGEVVVSAAQVNGDNGQPARLEIAVRDNGPGIPEKDLPRLTERFYRVDKARSRALGGTGLGLAIVKHIVQAHKGELVIHSEFKKGTTVRVLLPLAPTGHAHAAILFLCSGNSCRSQMAEGFARKFAASDQQIFSAGISPKGIHPLAARVMLEAGIDISGQRSKGLAEIPLQRIDRVITLCGDAAESCPVLPADVARAHWPLPDPAASAGTDEQVLETFRRVRDEIKRRVEALFS